MFKELLRKVLRPLVREILEEQLMGSTTEVSAYYTFPKLEIRVIVDGDPKKEHNKFIEIVTPGFDLRKHKVYVYYWDDCAGLVKLHWIQVVSSVRLGISTKWAANQGEYWKDATRYIVYYIKS